MKIKSKNETIKCALCGFKSPFKSLFVKIVNKRCIIGHLCFECSKALLDKEELENEEKQI